MRFAQVLKLLGRYGGVVRVRARAQAFTDRARALIADCPESPYQRALYSVTDLVTERDH